MSISKTRALLESCLQISSLALLLAFGLKSFAQPATELLEKMSVEEKVGQTMVWTFGGDRFSDITAKTIRDHRLGGLIVFSRNIKSIPQIARFNSDAQAFAAKHLKLPLFLMVDQEGGVVTRVKISTPIPSALALAQADDPSYIEDFARTKNELLGAIGFNVNLAPVLDVSDANQDSFMANRVFGNDPEKVAELSLAYARGVATAGLIPTAKHFPGHGGMVEDSHQSTPKKLSTWEELEKRDLVPFKRFIAAGMPKAVMMAHMSLPNIDPSGVPATYSHVIIQDHLRGRLGYNGIVITDDLEMGGASISDDIGERAIRAFLAGNDLLMFAGHPRNQRKAFNAMLTAVKTGRISQSRLNESVARIIAAKTKPRILPDKAEAAPARRKLEALSKEVMKKNFRKSLDSKSTQWPRTNPNSQAIVFASDPSFYNRFSRQFAGRTRFVRLTPSNLKTVTHQITEEKYQVAVFYVSGTATSRWINQLSNEQKAKTIVINCNNPGKIDAPESFMGVINLNSYSPEAGAWLAQSLNQDPALRAPAQVNRASDTDSEIEPEI